MNRRPRPRVHPVWEKFEEVHKPFGRCFRCTKCSGEFGIKSNTTVLKRHWAAQHKDEPASWNETSTLSQESRTNGIGYAPDTAINPIPMPVPVIIPMQDAASTSETTVRINKCKLEPVADNGTIETQFQQEKLSDAPDTPINPIPMPVPVIIPMQDAASTSETIVRINKRKLEAEADNGSDELDLDLENEMIETQIKREKLRNLKLSNRLLVSSHKTEQEKFRNVKLSSRLLELQIIEKERELGVSHRTDKGIQCDEWTTLIGQISR
ncbi:hypothetical protein Ddc_14869 [Ditylenchus destructor]|nr:hypothetical protein Ddc_14869 [Ditylenchus destructor]